MNAEGAVSSGGALPVMIGTAGHVDHGKTSLVRNLTAFNTDTLKEERARGMTIDFGVAPFRLPQGGVVGIIDVPGHTDFIRNMVAGASSIDVLLLVVAADDSVMPQTIEHLKIVSMLGMRNLVVALTKVDLVDAATLEYAREELSTLLTELHFAEAPIFEVSNTTLAGIEELRAYLAQLATEVAQALALQPATSTSFRMYVRKAFTMKGYGTVVTGVPLSGRLRAGDKLELLPLGKEIAVRAVQNYRVDVPVAGPHISTAINVRDVAPEEFSRGMVLATPGSWPVCRSVLAECTNCSNERLPSRFSTRFHIGTSAETAACKLIHGDSLLPGARGFLSIRFSQKMAIAAGDRFVIRSLDGISTLGGGVVLQLRLEAGPQGFPAIELFELAAKSLTTDPCTAYVSLKSSPILSGVDLAAATELSAEERKHWIDNQLANGTLVELSETEWLFAPRIAELVRRLQGVLKGYHAENRSALGMRTAQIAELFNLSVNAAKKLLPLLIASSDPAPFVVRNDQVALDSFKPLMTTREAKLKDQLLAEVAGAGALTIAKGDLLAKLGLSEGEFKTVTKWLIDEGTLVVLGNTLITKQVLDEIEGRLLHFLAANTQIELKDFREFSGAGRNAAVTLLEHFDAKGVTKRQGNMRVLALKKQL